MKKIIILISILGLILISGCGCVEKSCTRENCENTCIERNYKSGEYNTFDGLCYCYTSTGETGDSVQVTDVCLKQESN